MILKTLCFVSDILFQFQRLSLLTMAEGGRSLFDDNLTTCALCMETYKDPRALPCLHSFCYTCLENLLPAQKKVHNEEQQKKQGKKMKEVETDLQQKIVMATERKNEEGKHEESEKCVVLICPLCQEEHEVGSKGLSGFRKNFNIQTLIDKMEKDKNVTKKGGEKPRDSSSAIEPVEYCEKHKNEIARYFCQEKHCVKAICDSCWSNEHENHRVILLSKWIHNCKVAVQEDIEKCRNDLAENIAITEKAEGAIAELENNIQKVLTEFEHKKLLVGREKTKLSDQREQLLLLNDALGEASHLEDAMKVKDKVGNIKESIVQQDFKVVDGKFQSDVKEMTKSINIMIETLAAQDNEGADKAKYLKVAPEKTFFIDEWPVHAACLRKTEPNQMFLLHENSIKTYNTIDGNNIFTYCTPHKHKEYTRKNIVDLYIVVIENIEHMVQVADNNLEFYPAEPYIDIPFDKVCHTYAMPTQTRHFTCMNNVLAFSFLKEDTKRMMSIKLLNVGAVPPTKISEYECMSSDYITAMSLMENKKSYLLAMTAKWLNKGSYSTAVRAFNEKGEKQWDIPWAAFDKINPPYQKFETIDTNNNLFFLLSRNKYNSKGHIYTVSKNGQVLQNLLENLGPCKHLLLVPHPLNIWMSVEHVGDGSARELLCHKPQSRITLRSLVPAET